MGSQFRRERRSVSKKRQDDAGAAVLMVTRAPAGDRPAMGGSVRVASTVAAARDAGRSETLRFAVVDRSIDLAQRRRLLDAFQPLSAHVLFVGTGGGREAEQLIDRLVATASAAAGARQREWLSRLPVKRADEIVLLPTPQIASLEADGEMVHLTTLSGDRHTAGGPLTALEARLDPAAFIRLSRGVVVSVDAIARLRVLPSGSLAAVLVNGREMSISRSLAPDVRQRLVNL